MSVQPRILVADDEPLIRNNLKLLLQAEGYDVVEASDGVAAEHALADETLSLALLDLRMPGKDGLELLRAHQDRWETTPVVVITAYGGSAAAIEAMKLGAFDYITKPFELDEVLLVIKRALRQQSLVAQVQSLTASFQQVEVGEDEFIGSTPEMMSVFKMIGMVADTSESILILGESGTGKELVANAIHANSRRSAMPLIKVNCATFNASLLESELFGHERGAFTGAVSQRPGRFEQANGGTLFLDEIGELNLDLQAQFLRVLQTGRFERVGGHETIAVDVRVVAATNRDLEVMVKAGTFREDLLYRLNVLTIALPPLRRRIDDLPLIVDSQLQRLARKYGRPPIAIAPEAIRLLQSYAWPGNVRQLQNVISRAVILARSQVILAEDLIAAEAALSGESPVENDESLSLKDILARTEKQVIAQALQKTNWNRTRAAEVLGISRRQLFDKIQQYALTR